MHTEMTVYASNREVCEITIDEEPVSFDKPQNVKTRVLFNTYLFKPVVKSSADDLREDIPAGELGLEAIASWCNISPFIAMEGLARSWNRRQSRHRYPNKRPAYYLNPAACFFT